MIFLGFLIFCLLFVAGAAIGGVPAMVFFDIPSIVMVAGGILCFVMATRRFSTFRRGIRQVFRLGDIPESERKEAMITANFFRTLSYFSLVIGGFWSLMGFCIVLGNMDPETLGIGVAVSLMTLLYSFVLSATIFMPISIQYRNMVTEHRRHHRQVFSLHEKFPSSNT